MPEVELVAQALAAGATAGLTQTVERVARDAWGRLISLVRRERDVPGGEEPSTTDPGGVSRPVNDPDRAGKCNLVVNDIKGGVWGDNAIQNNVFH